MKIFESETYELNLSSPFEPQTVVTDAIWLDTYGKSNIFVNKNHFVINKSVKIFDAGIRPDGKNKEFNVDNLFYFKSFTNYQSFLFNVIKLKFLSKFENDSHYIIFNLNNHQRNFIADIGIDLSKIIDARDTYKFNCNNLFTISDVLLPPYNYKSEALNWYNEIYDLTNIKQDRKLYISRSDSVRRRVNGEHKLIKVLNELGYEVVVLEGLEIKAQAELFASASHIIAPHGSGLSNLVWCKPGTKVLEMFDHNYVKPTYASLAFRKNLNYKSLVFESPMYDIPGEVELPIEMAIVMNLTVDIDKIKLAIDSF